MTAYSFRVLGPFTVPTLKSGAERTIDFTFARNSVFEQAETAANGRFDIAKAIGCYVFGLSPKGGPRTWPYYVGKACDQTLHKRVFQIQDKADLYNGIVADYPNDRPFVYLLPLLTPSGALARLNSNANRIRIAEQELIGMAWRVNSDLWNVQHRAALDSFQIEGLTTSGQVSNAAKSLRTMLGRQAKKSTGAG